MSCPIDYDKLVDSAMRVLVMNVLRSVANNGLQSPHHFHITFNTALPGVEIGYLLNKYPQEMTIALQNQFKNLQVVGDTFEVTLNFNGQEERLTIPFCAITGFVDPSANFALKLDPDIDGCYGDSSFHEMLSGTIKKRPDKKINNLVQFKDIVDKFDKIN